MSDYFDFMFAALPHKLLQPEQFETEVNQLRLRYGPDVIGNTHELPLLLSDSLMMATFVVSIGSRILRIQTMSFNSNTRDVSLRMVFMCTQSPSGKRL